MAIFKKNKETEEKKKPENPKGVDRLAWKVLEQPYVSEKATELVKDNRYIFRIASDSNKILVKQAVEELYGVNIVSVNIINVPRKKKRLGKYKGWRKGFKKAIVEVKEGQRIDSVPK